MDPFCGSATTLLAADRCGARSVGIEAHPFVVRIAAAKLAWWSDVSAFDQLSRQVLAWHHGGALDAYPSLIRQCYPDEILAELDCLADGWRATDDGSPAAALCWLALTACLRPCSPVGTANMELIQPKKQKGVVRHPRTAFQQMVFRMLVDMSAFRAAGATSRSRLLIADARNCDEVEPDSIDLVITSPPYANNFDYADALRLEMSFWGEVASWADLHHAVRHRLLVSCAQHATADRLNVEELLARDGTRPIRAELSEAVRALGVIRLEKGGKKHYHTMVAAYFADMARVWNELRRVCRQGARVCMVIGDSAPYGVYLPVPRWLGELALAAGFSAYSFHKTRDRNVKWKNRKHRVPLVEGHLWVEA
jgi:hypothetical protein